MNGLSRRAWSRCAHSRDTAADRSCPKDPTSFPVERIGRGADPRCAQNRIPQSKHRSTSLLPQGSHESFVNGSGGVPVRGARRTEYRSQNTAARRCSLKDPTSQSLTDRAERRSAVRAEQSRRNNATPLSNAEPKYQVIADRHDPHVDHHVANPRAHQRARALIKPGPDRAADRHRGRQQYGHRR